jgi:hypothetical protein
MSEETIIENYRLQRATQDKIAYFLLTASGAGIGFAITRTQDTWLGWSQIPLGLAIMTWGLSFLFGCYHLIHALQALNENGAYIRLQDSHAQDPKSVKHEDLAQIREIWDALAKATKSANATFILQFKLVILGGVCYLFWHILEMCLRTTNTIYG